MSSALPTRRGLLKWLAAASVPMATGTAAAARPVAARPLRVAVVVPAGVPQWTAAFLTGIQATVQAPTATLQVLPTGSRLKEMRQVAAQAQALTPDLIITLGDGLAQTLFPALQGAHLPVIAAEVGVQLPQTRPPAPLTLHASLQVWESEWRHGQQLAAQGRPVHLLMSMLDSGHDLPYAFSAALKPGQLRGSTLLDPGFQAQPLADVLAQVRASGAQHVHVLAHGGSDPAPLLRALETQGLSLSLGGLTPERQARTLKLPGTAATDLASQSMTALGHDIGLWLKVAAETVTVPSALGLHAALAAASFEGVRGPLRVDHTATLRGAPLPLGAQAMLQASRQPLSSGWSRPFLHS